jgi:hypothetical protein
MRVKEVYPQKRGLSTLFTQPAQCRIDYSVTAPLKEGSSVAGYILRIHTVVISGEPLIETVSRFQDRRANKGSRAVSSVSQNLGERILGTWDSEDPVGANAVESRVPAR